MNERPVEIAFYGGNFLGLPQKEILALLRAAGNWIDKGLVDAIRFSTRPDTIDDQRMELIAPFPVKTIEIGAQSMDDGVLDASNRGHKANDTGQAVKRLKEKCYRIGIQLMVGLPGENEQTIKTNSCAVCELAPDFVRIYPTLVLAGSPLSKAYHSGDYRPLTLDTAVEKCAFLAARFLKQGIGVIRMGLPAEVAADPAQLIAGPYHPAFGHLVFERLYLKTAIKMLDSSRLNSKVTICVHPKGISNMRGLRNGNVTQLTKNFNLAKLAIVPDARLDRYQIAVGDQYCSILDAA
jgi:histone acetyltransferase (RNA polymerase elongator complex component)